MKRHLAAAVFTLVASFMIAGCAGFMRSGGQKPSLISAWQGRLAVRVAADLGTVPDADQHFSSGFELEGSQLLGELRLLTPLGGIAAKIHWTTQHAVMQSSSGEISHFDSIDALVCSTVGTHLPIAALFAWLDGSNADIDGWTVDLSQYAKGKITAHRTMPPPAAEIRIILDK